MGRIRQFSVMRRLAAAGPATAVQPRRWRRLSVCIASAVLCGAVVAADRIIVAGVELSERMRLGSYELVLASCGVRDTLWIDHYVAALYLPPGLSMVAAMQDPTLPKVILLHIVGTALLPDRIPEPWRETLRDELRREPMARVRNVYRNLAAGDRVRVAYVPNDGVTMAVNERVVARMPDHALFDSMLRAWAENDPISGKLERLLLQHPC